MNQVIITAMGDDTSTAILVLSDDETAVARRIVAAFEKDGTYAPTITIEVKEIK